MGTLDERQVAAAVDRVLNDVTAGLGPDAVRIDISFGTSPEIGIGTTEVTPTLTGLFLHPGETDDQLVVRLADTV